MIREVIYAPEAEAQLLQLYRYIAYQASPEIAELFTSEVMAQCERLTTFSERGTPRDDIRRGLRTIAFRRRVTIAYSVGELRVTILGIFYGGQDFEAILSE